VKRFRAAHLARPVAAVPPPGGGDSSRGEGGEEKKIADSRKQSSKTAPVSVPVALWLWA